MGLEKSQVWSKLTDHLARSTGSLFFLPRATEVAYYRLLNAPFPKQLAPVSLPERQPNRLLPASASRDAGVAAKMALCPRFPSRKRLQV